jgi:hypothetical protein
MSILFNDATGMFGYIASKHGSDYWPVEVASCHLPSRVRKIHQGIQSRRLLFPKHDLNWLLHTSLSPLTKRNDELSTHKSAEMIVLHT